ncbi:DUF4783 domain-containing protein [Sphingobacterium sp. lm-10]|uniref:DUF4783 domain-containing protein n=1 Tax=Sphingobacterium sp. lm-10 TaxID=2944904 RepID=UPI002021E882|nr:DUF4783 domain-containing protein [Sphingobacterium sp. lm-10]MCL7987546.1 DUF4783 domain-containing protein [Sphingobacterium sp. lm-10]
MMTDVLGDMEQEIYLGLKEGNAKRIAAYFADHVSVTLKNDTGYYSKFQSEMVLKEFLRTFRATEVKQVPVTTKSGKQNYRTYEFITSSQTFRVFVRFATEGDKILIGEIRIE